MPTRTNLGSVHPCEPRDLLIEGIGQLATPLGRGAMRGEGMGRIQLQRDVYLLIRDGHVERIGPQAKRPSFRGPVLHAEGRAVTPGLVDPHTHAVFAGSRAEEFLARARGKPYTGEGILATVEAVRRASMEELCALAWPRLLRMLRFGTTTVEIKSGYGLSTADELKMLRAIRSLGEELPLTVVPTFLGAHAFPKEETRERYIARLIEEMIPKVADEKLARFCDVFCDRGFYTVEEARAILGAALAAGLSPKLHADELAPVGAAELAAALHAVSADHLLHASKEGMQKLSAAGVVGVILPGTAFVLGEPYPPARQMIESGMAVALGTDFNPGSCPIASLPLVMSLSVLHLGLSPEETLCAATLNAAAALGEAEVRGSLEVGKKGDVVVWDTESFSEIPYFIGHELAWAVVKEGQVVWQEPLLGSWPTPS